MIIIGMGANIPGQYGSPENTLKQCLSFLDKRDDMSVKSVSSLWLSAPVPLADQPWYSNAVCEIKTELSPLELLLVLKTIEKDFGRADSERNAPRVLDLDIIAYYDVVLNDGPVLPHPRMHQRAFVLLPMREIAPDWVHPALNKSLDDLIKDLPAAQEIKQGGSLEFNSHGDAAMGNSNDNR